MSNKGFTIVELAIVLVVIGIILGMAVKGKSLVDSAKMRAEVAKLNKFEAAAGQLYAMGVTKVRDGIGAPGGYTFIPPQTFIDRGLLTKKDLEIGTSQSYWTFAYCSIRGARGVDPDGGVYGPLRNFYLMGYHSSMICVMPTTDGESSTYKEIDIKLACNIEIMKDDMSFNTGLGLQAFGRYTSANPTLGPSADAFKDCDRIADSYSNPLFGFRVLS